MAGISNQEWRQRALDKQRDDEARVGVLQKFLSQTRALGDANAKCVASCQKFTIHTQHSKGATSSAGHHPRSSGSAPAPTNAAPSAKKCPHRSGGALLAARRLTPRRAASRAQ